MDDGSDRDANLAAVRRQVRSSALVLYMAVMTCALRIALWAANEITLWRMYGWATVTHDHLSIVRIKPDLVVSNGDVLHGIGVYHYFVGVFIWLPLTFALLAPIYYTLLPRQYRRIWESKTPGDQSASVVSLLWALALFFLVTGLLPMWGALLLACVSVVSALVWARRIQFDYPASA